MSARSDGDLLRSFVETGSDEAFCALVQRYAGLVYALCLGEILRPELAEDASQAVFLLLSRRAERLDVRTSLVGWLYASARLVCKAARREERRRVSRERPLDERLASPAPDVLGVDIGRALARLAPVAREAVVLRFVQGFSLAEVARLQGTSEDAARMRIGRALDRMRPALRGHAEERFGGLTAPPALLAMGLRAASPYAQTLALALALATRTLMTTPLVFATGGLAAFTVVVAAQRTTLSALPPAQASARLAKVSAAAVVSRSGPSEKAGAFPALKRPFTLVYRCTELDLRTPAALDEEVAQYRRDLKRQANADRTLPEAEEAQVAVMRIRRAPRKGDVTLSYDGRTLYVKSNGLEGHAVFLVRGSSSYQFPQHAPGYDPSYSEGYELYTVTLPTIGASLPFLPFVKGGRTLVAEGAPGGSGKPRYNPGRVEMAGGRVVQIVNKFPERRLPYGLTKLSAHRRIAGVEVAGRVTYLEQGQDGRPSKSRQFRLISASDDPLPAERFNPEHYLPERTNFGVSSGRISRTFLYERAKGPLDAQIRAFRGDGRW